MSANDSKKIKAIEVIDRDTLVSKLSYQFGLLGLPENSEATVDAFVELVANSTWAKETKNGSLKYTTSKPELSENNKGQGTGTVTPFYLVSSGTGKTNALMSLRSFAIYSLAQIALSKKQASAKTFEEWLASNKPLFNMIESATDDMKEVFRNAARAEYKKYLDTLQLEAVTIEEE